MKSHPVSDSPRLPDIRVLPHRTVTRTTEQSTRTASISWIRTPSRRTHGTSAKILSKVKLFFLASFNLSVGKAATDDPQRYT